MAKRAANPAAPDPQDVARARFIEHGSDPTIARAALESATGLSRGLWLSFLTFGTYLAITFAGVDHRDLLLETPIVLPVLNAPLPLVTFFWVAPILFVIFHLYLLLSLKLLADQVHNYVAQMESVGLDSQAQDKARLQLPNFVIVQVLGGTSSQINSWAGKLLSFTAFLTLVAGPLLLLLFAQLMFLPYHGWWVTMAQRLTVVVDLIFIWYFWRIITRPEDGGYGVWSGAASAAVIVMTFFVLMYPGERFYGVLPKAVFAETGVPDRQVGFGIIYNTLVLPGERLIDDDDFKKFEDRNKAKDLLPWQGERSLGKILRNRDFRNADFVGSDFRKSDFFGSTLDFADLTTTSLQGASFYFASLKGTTFELAAMEGTQFSGAQLQRAVLVDAALQGAIFMRANLNGAMFSGASLQGASLFKAKLQGASLIKTLMHGADLDQADLRGAVLNGASLDGASLNHTLLQGAGLDRVSLQWASLDGASFEGASLRGTKVWKNAGIPVFGFANLEHLDVRDKPTQAFETAIKQGLIGVPETSIKGIEEAFLAADQNDLNHENAFDWKLLQKSHIKNSESEINIVQSLTETSCDAETAPFVAEGIVKGRLASFDPDIRTAALPLVLKLLAGCPGTSGIDPSIIVKLNQLKEKYSSGGAPTIGVESD